MARHASYVHCACCYKQVLGGLGRCRALAPTLSALLRASPILLLVTDWLENCLVSYLLEFVVFNSFCMLIFELVKYTLDVLLTVYDYEFIGLYSVDSIPATFQCFCTVYRWQSSDSELWISINVPFVCLSVIRMLSGWTLELFGNFLLPSHVGILMPIKRQSNQLDLQIMEGLCVCGIYDVSEIAWTKDRFSIPCVT